MNHTPKKPSNPPSTPGTAGKKPWPARLFAVGAVLLLVASGLVVVISGLMSGGAARDPAAEQSAYASQTLGQISALGTLDDLSRGRDLPGAGDIGADEVAALAKELTDAQNALQLALTTADNLPALPEGYIPGSDVGLDLPEMAAGDYKLPAFEDRLVAAAYEAADVVGDGSPVVNRTGLHLPSSGNPTVDEALGQLVGACAALRDALAQYGGAVPGVPGLPGVPGVPGVPVPVGMPADPCAIEGLDGLPVQDPTGIADGLGDPTDGLLDGIGDGIVPAGLLPTDPTGMLGGLVPSGSPSQHVYGANDAVDPDELGAVAAQLHAGDMLGTTGDAYTAAGKSLEGLLASYNGLAAQLEDLLAKAEDEALTASEAFPALLQSRLAEITAEATKLRGDAETLAAAYARTAQVSAEQALGVAEDAAKSHLATLQSRLDSEVAGLNAHATQVVELAESRKAAIGALVDSAVANLTRMSADSGIDATAQIAAIQAAGEAAVASLDAQAKAIVATLKESAALMQAQAQAAVPRLTAMGLRAAADINGTLEGALAKAEGVRVYLKDFATAQADKAMALEREAEAKAHLLLDEALTQHTTMLKTTALAMTSSVPDVVGSTSALVEGSLGMAETEVGKDVDYITKVASDYSKVPTEERKARALFWSTMGGVDLDVLESLGVTGDELTALAEQVMGAAEQAKADVEAVAG